MLHGRKYSGIIISMYNFFNRKPSHNEQKTDTMKQYRREFVILIFVGLYFAKIIFFSAVSGLWPRPENLVSFLAYNLVVVWLIATPALFTSGKKATYLFIMDVVLTLILLGDGYYLRFFGTLPVMSMLFSGGQIITDLPTWLSKLLSYTDLVLILDLIYIWFYRRKRSRLDLTITPTSRLSLAQKLVIAILPLILVGGLFGSDLAEKFPFLYNRTFENKEVAKNIGLFGAHFLDFSRNFVTALSPLNPSQKQATLATIRENSIKPINNTLTGTAAGKRIIMIQVESLGSSLVDTKVEGQEITPNINKLLSSSHYFANNYFTLGAGYTSDTDFSANTSLYPLTDSSVFVKYGKQDFTSLEKELKKLGYQADAYHANSRGYWNRDTVYKSLGFDHFYASDNYKSGAIINMGLSDADFLTQTVDYLKKSPTKSLSYVVTLTSHFSFEIPKSEQTLSLTKDKYSTLTANYLQAIHYTDSALGSFIEQLKTNGLYEDSIIVLYGDHKAKYDAFTADGGNIDPNTANGKKVPLMIKLPGETTGDRSNTPSTLLDIMPTLLNLVGAKPTSPMFGRDLFSDEKPFIYTSTFEDNYEQVISSDLKYLNTGAKESCISYNGLAQKTEGTASCDKLLEKRNQVDGAISTLIKHNLFNDYLKSE